MLLTTIFYHVDNFCNEIEKQMAIESEPNKGGRPCSMHHSEILTIHVFYQHSKIKTFKDYYRIYIKGIYRSAFTHVVSYNRFVELIEENAAYLALFAMALNGSGTGISFIDSTTISVCHNKRIHSHKVMKGLAQRSKSSMGWFYGFKLHFVINDQGDIIGFTITPGNVDDRDPKVIEKLTRELFGKLFGDRGYLSKQLFENLFERDLQLITKLKKNMPNILMLMEDKLLLKKRGIIESVGNLLKNFFNLEHTRHRSVKGFFCNIFSCLAAYAFHDNKPSLIRVDERLIDGAVA
jgi:hypothetical protein